MRRLIFAVIIVACGGGGGTNDAGTNDASSPDTGAAFGQNDAEFNVFFTDRQLSALQTAASMLGHLNEKKSLVYFASRSAKRASSASTSPVPLNPASAF